MLILGAGRDAERVVKHIASKANGRRTVRRTRPPRTLAKEVIRP
jgi:hypothetical protein